MTSFDIPDGVTSIGEYAFAHCTGLTSIDYGGTKEQWNSISKGSNWKSGATKVVHCTDGDVNIGE